MSYKTAENTCAGQILSLAFTGSNESPCSLWSSPPGLPAGRWEDGFVAVSCTVLSSAAFAQMGSGLSPAAPLGQCSSALSLGRLHQGHTVQPFKKKSKLLYAKSIN